MDMQGSGYGGKASATDREESELSDAARKVFAVPTPDYTLESKLERLISGVPLSDPKEREIFRYLKDMERAEGRLKSHDLSEREFAVFKGLEERRLRNHDISQGDIAKAKAKLKGEITNLVYEKTSSTKWADIFKSIPAPSQEQLSVVEKHDKQMPDLPDKVLDFLSQDPGPRIRAAGHLGIVLRPREFQYAILKKLHPEAADRFRDQGAVFKSSPPVMDGDAAYDPGAPISPTVLRELTELIGDFLKKRSLAPSAVRIRMSHSVQPRAAAQEKEEEHPLLEKVSSLYNEYRGGLLARPLDWRYVPIGFPPLGDLAEEEKLAAASQELSTDLLRLAYWPAIPVG